jgi:hypothetical protein
VGENIELLIGIQDQVIKCRRLAAELSDPQTARFLRELADEVERRAREVDRDAWYIFFQLFSVWAVLTVSYSQPALGWLQQELPSMSERSVYLRDQAQKCMLHAAALSDAYTQGELRKLASQYTVEAAEIESKEALALPLP